MALFLNCRTAFFRACYLIIQKYSKNNRNTMTKTKKSLSKLNQDHLSIMVCGESCPECTLSQAICDEMDTKRYEEEGTYRSYSLESENME